MKNNLIIAALTATLLCAGNNAQASYVMSGKTHALLFKGSAYATATAGAAFIASWVTTKFLGWHRENLVNRRDKLPQRHQEIEELEKRIHAAIAREGKFKDAQKYALRFLG